MNPDPILEEVHRAKEAVAAKYGFDVQKMVEDMMKRQGEDGREVVKLPPRKIEAA
jgi:hypothetical protein